MGRSLEPKCKKCRRDGEKLFLRGDRCHTPKCAVVKRNYPPGIHGQKGKPRLTPYGLQFREKQKAKKIYGILEKQFGNYCRRAAKRRGDTSEILSQVLERRLDNVIYRLGFAKSRSQARQLISHGHFLINGRKVNIPSYQLKNNDLISLKEKSLEKGPFKDLNKVLEKQAIPGWLSLDPKELKAKVISKPSHEDIKQNIDMRAIIEYYSR